MHNTNKISILIENLINYLDTQRAIENRVASVYRVYTRRILTIRSKRREKFATKIKLLSIYLVYVY